MYPELIHIGPITVYSYGAAIAAAVLLALYLINRQAPREGLDPAKSVDFTVTLALAGLVGSRVLYIILNWADFAGRPAAILGFGQGQLQGLSIHGGLAGGLIAGYVLARRHRLAFWRLADVCARPLAAGMAIGRIGCFLAGCCYGQLTGAGWGCSTVYAPGLRHPSQLYESLLLLALFAALSRYMLRARAPGQLFGLYLAGYGLARFGAEMFRESERLAGPLSLAQLVSLALIAAGLAIWRRRAAAAAANPPKTGTSPA